MENLSEIELKKLIKETEDKILIIVKNNDVIKNHYKEMDGLISAKVQPSQKIIIQENDIYTGKVDNYTDKTIDGLFRVKEIAGMGNIEQILIKSTSDDYTIDFIVDDRTYYSKPYSYFSTLSKYMENMSAFLQDGYYYLSIRNVPFQKGYTISIQTITSTDFAEIILKYTIRDEVNK